LEFFVLFSKSLLFFYGHIIGQNLEDVKVESEYFIYVRQWCISGKGSDAE